MSHTLPVRRTIPSPGGRPSGALVTLFGNDGTSTLVETRHARVLVDCGSAADLARLDVSTLDAVVLTHAHPDHTGGLAALARHGFRGELVGTPATLRLADVAMRDALPACGADDHRIVALRRSVTTMSHALEQPVGTTASIAQGVACTLRRAGHTLGSVWVRLDLDGGASLVVSGDLGRHGHELLRGPEPFMGADAVLVEAVHGRGRRPAAAGLAETRDLLAHAVYTTLERGGTVFVPAGPTDHAVPVLYELARLRRTGCMPEGTTVYLDSPTGLAAVDVWRRAVAARDGDLRASLTELGPDAFDPGTLLPGTPDADAGPCVVVGGPRGGAQGAAARHLTRLLPDARNTVLVPGSAPAHSIVAGLADGAAAVVIDGRPVTVAADVVPLPGLTAHADAAEVVEWLGHGAQPSMTYVVHGEPDAREALRSRVHHLLEWPVVSASRATLITV